MGKHVAEATVATTAPPDLVWAILADARSWDTWGPWTSAELEREGAPEADGVGAIRVFTKKPIVSREEVVVFEPPARLEYRLLSGLPVRDYHAVVRITSSDAGSEIHWRSEFDSKVPGMRAFLGRVIPSVAERLAGEADRRAAA